MDSDRLRQAMTAAPTAGSIRPFAQTLPPRAREIDQLRRLPDDVVAGLIDTGIFRMFVPRSYGGHQQDLLDGLSVIEELSYWDGSVGWCAMIGATTALQAAHLPVEHADDVYGTDPRAVTGGVAESRGSARRVDGGIVASGTWSWASGAHHCQWLGGGCRLETDGEEAPPPRQLFVFFERQQVTLHDNWHVGGLRGTGSVDFTVQEVFVPQGRWVDRSTDRSRVDDALYRFPHFGLLALGVTAVGLGMARRALDELRELAANKRYVGSRRTLAQRPVAQAAVGEAEARLLSARAFIDSAASEAYRAARDGELALEPRRRLRLAATLGMGAAVEVVDRMYELAGGSAVFESSPLERLFRDIHVAASHAMVAPRTYELTGRLALGLETDVTQL